MGRGRQWESVSALPQKYSGEGEGGYSNLTRRRNPWRASKIKKDVISREVGSPKREGRKKLHSSSIQGQRMESVLLWGKVKNQAKGEGAPPYPRVTWSQKGGQGSS